MKTVEQRISSLEASGRRMRAVTILAVAIAMVGVGVAARKEGQAPVQDQIRCRELQIVDDNGRMRLKLMPGEFAMYNEDERRVTLLAHNPSVGTYLTLKYPRKSAECVAGVSKDAIPEIQLWDAANNVRKIK